MRKTMTKAEMAAETEKLLRKARYGKRRVKVTRCPDGIPMGVWNGRRGGMLPSDLDPVKLQLTRTDDEHREVNRLDRISASLQR